MIWLFALQFSAAALSLNNAPLEELMRATTEVTGETYAAHGELCERFTVEWPRDVTRAEARAAFLTALSGHAYNLVPVDGTLTVKNGRCVFYDSLERPPCRAGFDYMVTVILRLAPEKMAAVRAQLSRDGIFEQIPGASSIVVSDRAPNIAAMREAALLPSP